MVSKLGFIVFGYTTQAKWCFDAIHHSPFSEIKSIVVPPKNIAQKRATFYDMWLYSKQNSIPLIISENVNDSSTIDRIQSENPDYLFQTGWHEKIKERLINIPTRGFLSIHPSFLPEGKGGAVLNWAIINGYKEWGTTLYFLNEDLDAGPIVDQKQFKICKNDYIKDVYHKANIASKKLLEVNIPKLQSEHIKSFKQKNSISSTLRRRSKNDGQIDWSWSSEKILKYIRALSRPFHGAYSYLQRNNYEVSIFKAKIINICKNDIVPGTVINLNNNDQFSVKTIDGMIVIDDYSVYNNNLNLLWNEKGEIRLGDLFFYKKK